MGAGGVIGGSACALYTGNLSVWPAMLCLVAMLSAQMGINLLKGGIRSKGAVAKSADQAEDASRNHLHMVLQEFAKGCFLVTALAFVGLVAMSGYWALVPCAFLGLVMYLYVGSSSPLFGSWWEQVCQFLFFGPVAVYCTFFYQALHNWGSFAMVMTDSGPALLSSIVIGLLAVNACLVGDCLYDKKFPQVKRDNFAAHFGAKGVSWAVFVTGAVFYALEWVLTLYYPAPRWGLVIMIPSLSFVINIVVAIAVRKDTYRRLERVYTLAIMNPFIYSLLSLIVLLILREPDHGGFVIFD